MAGAPGDFSRADPAADATPAKPPVPGSGKTAEAAAADLSGDAQIRSSRDSNDQAAQAASQAGDDAAPPEPADSMPSTADRNAATALSSSAASSAGTDADAASARDATGAAKTDAAAGLPNFGWSPATTTAAGTPTASATVTALGATAAAAVPVAGLAVAIAARAKAGSHQFDIRLDPPELGRIDVRLDVNTDGQVTTHMTADRADTLQLLQSQQPHLEHALEQAGLRTADNGLQFTLRDQSFSGQQNGSNSQPNGAARLVVPEADSTSVAAAQVYLRGSVGGGVDIRV